MKLMKTKVLLHSLVSIKHSFSLMLHVKFTKAISVNTEITDGVIFGMAKMQHFTMSHIHTPVGFTAGKIKF